MKKVRFRFSLLLGLIGIFSLACIITLPPKPPAETQAPPPPPPVETQAPLPQDTPTSLPTSTPEPLPTPTPEEAPAFFTDEFDVVTDFWSYFIINGVQEKNQLVENPQDEPKVSVHIEDGFMKFGIDKNYQYVYVTYDPYTYTDVRVDVRAENRGVNNNNVSIICRYTEEGWYEFNIANNGLYWIYYAQMKPSKQVSYALIANGGSNKIRMGKDVNEYTAICKGRTLQLFINGYEVKTLTENRYALREGQVGVSVSSFNVLPVQVDIDWVKVSQP